MAPQLRPRPLPRSNGRPLPAREAQLNSSTVNPLSVKSSKANSRARIQKAGKRADHRNAYAASRFIRKGYLGSDVRILEQGALEDGEDPHYDADAHGPVNVDSTESFSSIS